MKKTHTINRAFLNTATAIVYQVINTVMGLVLPYLFITEFGSETNGLLSSVAQLFVYLSLLEGGVGAASTQALYAPIAKFDRKEISSIMAATTQYYRRIAPLYSALVVVLAIVYPFFVETTLSATTVRAVILLQGAGSVLTYLFQGRFTPLLKAEGRLYVLNGVLLASSVLRNVGKIVVISLGYDVVAVQIIHFVLTVIQIGIIGIYFRRKYAWIDKKAEPNQTAISQKNSAMLQQLTWIVFSHTDIMVLTVVSRNLALVSVYSIYTLIFEAIQNLLDTIFEGLQYKMGRSAQESQNSMRSYFSSYERIYLAVAFALFAITYIMARPFISLYVGDVKDADYLLPWLAELFLILKVLNSIRMANRKAVEAVGHFRATQKIVITEMLINITVSVCLASWYNIYGVLIGTIVALVFSAIAYVIYVNKTILCTRLWRATRVIMLDSIVLLVVCVIGQRLIIQSGSYFNLVLQAAVVFCVVMSIFVFVAWIESRTSVSDKREVA